jgi:MFS family permease
MQTTATSAARVRQSVLLTLLLAYAGFIALGLGNSLMGVAWPSVRTTFGMPIDALGILLIGNTTGYMLASATSGRLIARLQIGVVLALSCGIAALSLLGSGSVPFWALLVVLSFTYGLGGGMIDAGLNAYAADHFSPRAMNWLHACFGIGATVGPAIMTAVVVGGFGWQAGFWIAGATQLALAACFVVTRTHWQGSNASAAAMQQPTQRATLGQHCACRWHGWASCYSSSTPGRRSPQDSGCIACSPRHVVCLLPWRARGSACIGPA